MKPKHRRLWIVVLALVALGGAAALVLNAFEDNLVFFYSPTDLETKHVAVGQSIRVGGLVEEGSVQKSGVDVHFRITDGAKTIGVAYTGVLPDLFREGQGVVTTGRLAPDGTFRADEVLAKHDEKYMPPEVADALKAAGEWKPTATN
ncbi:MAG: cytochrome c maturation protein CcmE [Alphaproteobacteria bacterium]|nr:cytochrome c maturation protein CcmE [Alphaproteobacteria bacterium]